MSPSQLSMDLVKLVYPRVLSLQLVSLYKYIKDWDLGHLNRVRV